MNKLARALYDNTAECADELAFRKGDIVTVMDQSVAGTSGWWMCSLYGRHGLAPANRLKLLPQAGPQAAGPSGHEAEKPQSPQDKNEDSVLNIYQIPSVPKPSHSPAYERMDVIYKVPSTPLSSMRSPTLASAKHDADEHEMKKTSAIPGRMPQINSWLQISELEKRFNSHEGSVCSSPADSSVYEVPSPLTQVQNYDFPVPAAQQKMMIGCQTMPKPCKAEWIYDVPAGSEKQDPPQDFCDSFTLKSMQLYDTLPARVFPIKKDNPASLLYDIPRPSSVDITNVSKVLPQVQPCNTSQTIELTEMVEYDVPPKEKPLCHQVASNLSDDHKPLECRGDSSNISKMKRERQQRIRAFLACTSFTNLPGNGELLVQDEEKSKTPCLSTTDSQRISTASSSSSSSCDSFALSSSSPEPHREVALSQEEACRKLFELQESVCTAVPQLMEFVSSNWRCKQHLEKHLEEIKAAAEVVAFSLMGFLTFALDVKGNARRLTDANLQSRLNKQLSIVEDSGVILQQTVSALNMAGWPLSTLCQDPGHVQTPDQLDRFVMVARTVPDDVKHLVSIIHANGKLLFKGKKNPEAVSIKDPPEPKQSPDGPEPGRDPEEDENDYVVLQTTDEEKKGEVQTEPNDKVTLAADTAKTPAGSVDAHRQSSVSEHCRLYFGALQKAIGGFVGSLQQGQPPEKFISKSKLVIMVGQRLVDTMCREAHKGGPSQSLLCKSNHLCALLKQLAVATKKAALHFPDKEALHEAQEFAKELAQRAQHFRISLEL
ncbi:cas scaffolding protein family member 4 isoform 2-T2 [Menidia menidia]